MNSYLITAKQLLTTILAAALCLQLTACGGGGGGGGGNGSQGARILHASLDSAPFNLTASDQPDQPLLFARFSLPVPYAGIPKGEHILTATSALGGGAFTFAVPAGHPARQSILIYGSRDISGLKAALLTDEPGEIPATTSALRLINGAEDLNTLSASAGGTSIAQNLPLGGASAYTLIGSGVHEIIAQEPQNAPFYRGTHELLPGKAYTILVAGESRLMIATRVLEDG